jgi:predicted esterase
MKNLKYLIPVLLIFIAASPGRAQEADSFRILSDRASQAYRAKDYQGSVREYLALIRLYPDDAVAAFNTACCYSLLNKKKEALKWLERAVDLGFYRFDPDPDMANVRNTGQYKKILARALVLQAELDDKISRPVIGLPPDYDSTKTYGLMVSLHGYGSNPNNIMQGLSGVPQKMGYIVLAPYGTHPLGRDRYNWGNRDDAEVKVLETIKTARSIYKIDPSRIILLGFSLGASHAYYIGTKNAGLFRGIIPIAGMYDSSMDQFLPRSRENKLRVYIMFGELEPDEMAKANLEAVRSFIMSGISASLNVYAFLGHEFPPKPEMELRRAIEWIEKN